MGGSLEEEAFKLGLGSRAGLAYAEMRSKGISEDEIWAERENVGILQKRYE